MAGLLSVRFFPKNNSVNTSISIFFFDVKYGLFQKICYNEDSGHLKGIFKEGWKWD